MTIDHDHRPGDEDRPARPESSRSWGRNRTRAAVGVAGLAGLLGAGAYLITNEVIGDRQAITTAERISVVSIVPGQPDQPGKTADRGAEHLEATPKGHDGRLADAEPKTPKERVAAAREAAARDGVKVMHPVSPKNDAAGIAAAEAAKVTTTGSIKDDGATMRVVTARGDLTGQRELAWVAGDVTRQHGVDCSQKFRFSNEQDPERRENLLVCWRTSAKRSVVTVSVDTDGNPSTAQSAAVIEREWRKLE